MFETILLQPMVVLLLWTIAMLFLLASRRIPELGKLKVGRGANGDDIDAMVSDRAKWASHNYAHLHEQPTLFYATVLGLLLMGDGSGLSQGLAWAYVAIRILHSLEQVFTNRVKIRSLIFFASSACLIGLILKLAYAVFV